MGLLFGVLLLVMMGFSVLFPIEAYYVKRFGADAATMGIITGIYSLMQFLFAPIWGRLSDRVGRRPVLMIGLLGYVVSNVMFGLATQLWMLFAARTLAGLLSAAAMPTAMAYIADITPPEDRAKGMGLLGAAFGLGVILGPGLGGALGTIALGLPFFVSAGLSFVAFLCVLAFLPESLPPAARRGADKRHEPRWKAISGETAALYGVTLALSLGMAGIEVTFAFFAADRLHLQPNQTSWIFVVMGIVSVIVQGGLVGKAQKALGEPHMMLAGLVVGALGMAGVALTHGAVAATAAICVLAVGSGFARPANSALISRRARGGQGVAIGLMDSVDSLGRIIGPTAAGAIYRVGPGLPYVTGASLFAIAFGLSLFWVLTAASAGEAEAPGGNLPGR
jgi:multidrug resistance protein